MGQAEAGVNSEEMLEFERSVIRKTWVHSNLPEEEDGNLSETAGANVKDAPPAGLQSSRLGAGTAWCA